MSGHDRPCTCLQRSPAPAQVQALKSEDDMSDAEVRTGSNSLDVCSTVEAVLLDASTTSASQVRLGRAHHTGNLASLLGVQEDGTLQHTELSLNTHIADPDLHVVLVHAHLPRERSSQAGENASKGKPDKNALANDVLLPSTQPAPAATEEEEVTHEAVYGNAIVKYRSAKRPFKLHPDWDALHSALYGVKLGKMVCSKDKGHSTISDSDAANYADIPQKAAAEFQRRLAQSATASPGSLEAGTDVDEDEDWTDEDVEQPREPKKLIDSEDEEQDQEGSGEDEDGDSDGSYESEPESDDDDDDPRKQAILNTIRDIIMKDGKLDLEKLGLEEKGGKLVPKDK